MAYTYNCTDCSQRDQQFQHEQSKQRFYENMEDDIPEIGEEEVRDREACLACEDKFCLLPETEKKDKKERNIQFEKDKVAQDDFDWSQIAKQPRRSPAKPYCYVDAVLNQQAARDNKRN